jgi:hypothetical protein
MCEWLVHNITMETSTLGKEVIYVGKGEHILLSHNWLANFISLLFSLFHQVIPTTPQTIWHWCTGQGRKVQCPACPWTQSLGCKFIIPICYRLNQSVHRREGLCMICQLLDSSIMKIWIRSELTVSRFQMQNTIPHDTIVTYYVKIQIFLLRAELVAPAQVRYLTYKITSPAGLLLCIMPFGIS